ncbi:MAG: redoxin domain-containing protein [Anaerolineales bacterium]|nr:redoxin domain-containing protein [Anaerolineales bacterium]
MFCREWLAQLEQHQDDLRAAGLSLAAIGIGEPKHAQRYCGSLAPSVTCLVNKSLEAYRAYGLKQGQVLQLVGPQVLAAGARAVGHGHTQGETTGNALMLGGVFVIDGQGIVRFADYDEYAGDHPVFAHILHAARELRLSAA